MKAKFNESNFCTWIDLEPETPEDVAALARMVQNTKAEKPELRLSLSERPMGQIYMQKINKSVQKNELSNIKS